MKIEVGNYVNVQIPTGYGKADVEFEVIHVLDCGYVLMAQKRIIVVRKVGDYWIISDPIDLLITKGKVVPSPILISK
jgi:hypothetical protein